MCVKQKCTSVADLRASVYGDKACPNDCNGNGVCNSLGHCHCNPGFRPPDCVQPGMGGSNDSGPAEDPNARNDFIIALYVIFLGVVPAVALLLLGIWYIKNSGQYWKKDIMSTYVSSLDCFKEKRKTHANKPLDVPTAKTHYTAGSKFLRMISAYFASKKNASHNANDKVFTISDNTTLKKSLQITKTDLISTTNPDAIKCSNSIEYRKSLLFGKSDVSANSQVQNIATNTFSVPAVEFQSKKVAPLGLELGSKISERIQQIQRKSPRNIKGLTLNTEFKFEHLNESPASTSDITPKTSDELLSHSKTPAPFYNKKPPPPPAPAQNLKPKI